MQFNIKGFRTTELAEVLNISKPAISDRFKDEVEEVVRSGAVKKQITEVLPEGVQRYFVDRGYGSLFEKTNVWVMNTSVGGSAKTTSSLALSSYARRIKARKKTIVNGKEISPAVIVIDTDSQASATLSLLGGKAQADDKPILNNYLRGECSFSDLLEPLGDELYLVPSNLQNVYIEKTINGNLKLTRYAGKNIINELDKKFGQGYFAIFDTPPAISSLTTSLVLGLAELDSTKYRGQLLCPIRSMDLYGIQGASITVNEAMDACAAFGLPLPTIHAFITFYNRIGRSSLEVLKRVLENETLKSKVLDQVIRYTSDFSKSNLKNSSVFNGTKSAAAEDFASLFLTLFGYETPLVIGNA